MQSQIVVLQQQVNVAMLQAARIVNPASQQHVLMAIQAVGTVVGAILSLVQSVSSKAAVAQMSAGSTIKISAVRAYMNDAAAAEIVAGHLRRKNNYTPKVGHPAVEELRNNRRSFDSTAFR